MCQPLLRNSTFICSHGTKDMAQVVQSGIVQETIAKWHDMTTRGRYLSSWKEDVEVAVQIMKQEELEGLERILLEES